MDADQRAVLLQGQQEVCMQEGRLVDTTGKEDAEAQPVTILSTARSRLLRHCKGNQGPSSWAEQQQQQQQQEERHAPASDRSSPQLARVFRCVSDICMCMCVNACVHSFPHHMIQAHGGRVNGRVLGCT
eukprot:1144103-Pelagomonas_calceolata.AAC.7